MAMQGDFEKDKGLLITVPVYDPKGVEFGKVKATNIIEGGGLLFFSSSWDGEKLLPLDG